MENVKQNISWLWRNIEKILIILFLLTFTFNVRKVFLTPFSFLNGGFNEYMTISLNWADVLMILTILIYTIKYIISQFKNIPQSDSIQYNNNINKSMYLTPSFVSRETFWLLLFLGWAGLSILWSQYQLIATYRFFVLLEIVIFAYIAIKLLIDSKWLKIALSGLILNGVLQSVIGVAQFINNSSLQLHFLGESILGPNIDGVAKIIINGEKHIRAYGTFPHPNVLAGFLLVPLFILVGEISRRGASRETFFAKLPCWLLWIILLIIGCGFLLTFSRSAFLGFFVGVFIVFIIQAYTRSHTDKPSGSPNKTDTSFVSIPSVASMRSLFSGYLRPVSVSIIILAIALIMSLKYTSFFSSQSLQERKIHALVSYETIYDHPLAGVGLGQFVLNQYIKYPDLLSWQYQPVHNAFLLVASELGLIGLVLLLVFISTYLFNRAIQPQKENNSILTLSLLYGVVISFLLVSIFDHYLWDIKVGIIVFALPFIFFSNRE